jgi:hypothetical protein
MTIDQLLSDPLVRTLMVADRLDAGEVATTLREIAREIAVDQPPQERSIIDRLIIMLAAYYGAALCDCMGAQFQICKAS